ncbi:hypothetical protein DTW90_03495 [Neorhizobium sp. P12A]|uniref:SprT family zinc-dependent metalloprotease n=1 Tax=Neorhizobium sp. P12A TaxID=2268027 RepID=UPI0011EC5FA5|nr:SprT family zinc-dependent metalloprotease [Neorhizobium sp. P12A]KAA0700713.1 hypothetical protein DTW90_03495 [Neorhizobium sp. P12A]
MFWKAKPTISFHDEEWQISAWEWLFDNLGGLERLKRLPSHYPRQVDFPRSGLSGHAHVAFVFSQLCGLLGLDSGAFELLPQQAAINPHLGPLAVVQNAPHEPLGTYSSHENAHVITYDPVAAKDLERLIATLAHELCHAILFSIPERPADWAENEEFATDLATVFFGFGIFGGNGSFEFSQFRDDATGSQGWSTRRAGYLTQNEWGFALAVRAILTGEDVAPIKKYSSDGLYLNFRKNYAYLERNPDKLAGLRA